MEIFIVIFAAILTVLLGFFTWNVQRLHNVLSALQEDFVKFRINEAGATVACKATHEKINEKIEEHEGRIHKLENPVKKNRKSR